MTVVADKSVDTVALICVMMVILIIVVAVTVNNIRQLFTPKSVYRRLLKFFGKPHFAALQTHEKTYPGYDLPSVHAALNSLFDECCADLIQIGAFGYNRNLRDAINSFSQPFQRGMKPSQPSYERIPVDIDHDESFITNCP